MSENTKIEWCDHTFNPWIGCTQISPACDNCYAKAWDRRFAVSGHAMHWGAGVARKRTSIANWKLPLKWNRAAEANGIRPKVFCASLADVFDNEVDPQWRVDLLQLIADTPHIDWLLLTKRIGNARQMLNDAMGTLSHRLTLWDDAPWPNVWIGATITSQIEADRDIPKLLDVPASKRFLSMEPLLGPVEIGRWIATAKVTCKKCSTSFWLHEAEPCEHRNQGSWTLACPNCGDCKCESGWTPPGERLQYMEPPGNWIDRKVGRFDKVHPTIPIKSAIDWVIVGGESGHNARPMHPDWAYSLRDQCNEAGVPFLFKQWGDWHPAMGDTSQDRLAICKHTGGSFHISAGEYPRMFDMLDRCQMHRVGKKAAGRMLAGREWNGVPA